MAKNRLILQHLVRMKGIFIAMQAYQMLICDYENVIMKLELLTKFKFKYDIDNIFYHNLKNY